MRKANEFITSLVEAIKDRISGAGISRMISMSNTRKITARRKKRVENGIRAFLLGSNPHSKGVVFSRSLCLRALSM